MSGAESPAINVIVQHRGHPGLLAGIFGCIFGLLGIFSWGLIFVPLAAICSIIGLFRGCAGRSGAGVGTSILAALLSVWGFVVSPSLWLAVGGSLLAHEIHGAAAPTATAPTEAARLADRSPQGVASDNAVQEERRFIEGLNPLVDRMQHLESYAGTVLTNVPRAEQRYQAITAKMTEYLTRERALVRNPNAEVARSQISVAINQGSIATEQLHNEIQPTQWDFENNAVPLMKQVNAAEAKCRNLPAGGSDSVSTTSDNRNAACKKLSSESERFKSRYDALSRSLQDIEGTYQQARKVQDGLVQEAERIE